MVEVVGKKKVNHLSQCVQRCATALSSRVLPGGVVDRQRASERKGVAV